MQISQEIQIYRYASLEIHSSRCKFLLIVCCFRNNLEEKKLGRIAFSLPYTSFFNLLLLPSQSLSLHECYVLCIFLCIFLLIPFFSVMCFFTYSFSFSLFYLSLSILLLFLFLVANRKTFSLCKYFLYTFFQNLVIFSAIIVARFSIIESTYRRCFRKFSFSMRDFIICVRENACVYVK